MFNVFTLEAALDVIRADSPRRDPRVKGYEIHHDEASNTFEARIQGSNRAKPRKAEIFEAVGTGGTQLEAVKNAWNEFQRLAAEQSLTLAEDEAEEERPAKGKR
jgi:hypothetical protein